MYVEFFNLAYLIILGHIVILVFSEITSYFAQLNVNLAIMYFAYLHTHTSYIMPGNH